MNRRSAKRECRPILEGLEGKQLLSTGLHSHAAESLQRATPVHVNSVSQTTVLTQLGGPISGAPGAVVTMTADLAFVDRTGLRHALMGRSVSLYISSGSGYTLVGTAGTNRQVISGRDSYGEASFSYRIPGNAAHGSTINFQIRFAGELLYSSSTGSARVNVR